MLAENLSKFHTNVHKYVGKITVSFEQANDGISVVYIYVDLEDRKRLKFIDRNDH